MNVTLCQRCFTGWAHAEILTIVPLNPCMLCGADDARNTGGPVVHCFRSWPFPPGVYPISRRSEHEYAEIAEAMTGKDLVETMRSSNMEEAAVKSALLTEAVIRTVEMLYKVTDGAH